MSIFLIITKQNSAFSLFLRRLEKYFRCSVELTQATDIIYFSRNEQILHPTKYFSS